MAKFEDTLIKCPYYNWEEGKVLCCEGVDGTSEESVTKIHFATYERRRAYERRVCRKNWKTCPMAQALEKKW